jgi:2'-5' RNA ligase
VSDERARLFVALELPGEVREALVRWRSPILARLPGLRAVAPGAMHVTLCFLGWRSEGEIKEIGAACQTVSGEPAVLLSLHGPVWLPPKRPRVLAVQLDDAEGALARIQSELSRALQAGGWYVPETRPFFAHVTVARVSRGARVRPPELAPAPLLAPAPELAPAPLLAPAPELHFDGSTVVLFRSRLGPAGARYEPLERVELGGERGE